MRIDRLPDNMLSDDISEFVFRLMNEPLFLPDILRDYNALTRELKRQLDFPGNKFWGLYRDDDKIGGVIGITSVVPAHEARFLLWIWERAVLTPRMISDISDIIKREMKENALARLWAQVACKNAGRILKLLGFVCEGKFKYAFKHDKKLYTLFQYRRIGG